MSLDLAFEIPLSKGHLALIDAADWVHVAPFKWTAVVLPYTSYAYRRVSWDNQNRRWRGKIYLHRFLMQPEEGLIVDHLNGDGLDNRRCSLCITTQGQNVHRGRRRAPKSGYRGVIWSKGTWIAQLCSRPVGYFKTAELAARAYDAAAIARFGEFAIVNFPNEQTSAARTADSMMEG